MSFSLRACFPTRHPGARLCRMGAAALLLGCLWAASAHAELATQQLVLRDGTVIVGSLESLAGGTYVMNSPTLGRVEIPAAQVQSFRAVGAPQRPPAPGTTARTPAPGTQPRGAATDALADQLMRDPALVQDVMALGELPAMQEILADPELLDLVQQGDLEALANDPRIQRLMGDPQVRELTTRVAPASP